MHIIMEPTRKKPKYTRDILRRHTRHGARLGRGCRVFYWPRRYQFYRAGFKTVRLPGRLWSPEFMAAYQIALACQMPIKPGKCNPKRAERLSIYANVLFKTEEFQRLRPHTQKTYKRLIREYSEILAGRPRKHPWDTIRACRLLRNASRREVEGYLSQLRMMLIDNVITGNSSALHPPDKGKSGRATAPLNATKYSAHHFELRSDGACFQS